MSNMVTANNQHDAVDADQWALIYIASPAELKKAHHIESGQCSSCSSSIYEMEVFDTEAEITTRVGVLGFEMPE